MKRTLAIAGLCLAFVMGGNAVASGNSRGDGLAGEHDINDGIFVLAVADQIRRGCDRISARFFRALGYTNRLKALARSRGYSDEEIDAYINDKREQAKMRLRRDAYFESRGAGNLDADSLCALGGAEIAHGTQVGQLLREK